MTVIKATVFLIFCFILLISSPSTYVLHLELLNFMLIAMSTQLLSGPSPGLKDVNPFIDSAMAQVTMKVLVYWQLNFLDYLFILFYFFIVSYILTLMFRRALLLSWLCADCYSITSYALPWMLHLILYSRREVSLVFYKKSVPQLVCRFLFFF